MAKVKTEWNLRNMVNVGDAQVPATKFVTEEVATTGEDQMQYLAEQKAQKAEKAGKPDKPDKP